MRNPDGGAAMTAIFIEADDVAMGNSPPLTRELEPEAIGECKSKADP